jgi:hypothetical protein
LLYRNSQNGKFRDNIGPGVMPKALLLVHVLTNVRDVSQIIATLNKKTEAVFGTLKFNLIVSVGYRLIVICMSWFKLYTSSCLNCTPVRV